MIENNRCANCGHKVTNEMIMSKNGYKINSNYYVCGNCYKLFFDRAREYVYKNPNASRQIISKFTSLPLKLIDLFCDEGALIETVSQQKITDELNKQNATQEENEYNRKMRLLNELKNSLNPTQPDTSMQRVTKAKESSNKMRFLDSDHRRKF